MANFYTVQQVAALADCALQTVHTWSAEFARHLSPTANPGKRKQRMFTREDMAVLLLVAQLKADGMTYADIHAALDTGQRAGVPEATPDELQTMIATDDRRQLAAQNEALIRQVDELKREIATLRETDRENIRLQAQMEMLREQLAQATLEKQSNAELREEIGRLKGLLEALRER